MVFTWLRNFLLGEISRAKHVRRQRHVFDEIRSKNNRKVRSFPHAFEITREDTERFHRANGHNSCNSSKQYVWQVFNEESDNEV